MYVHVSANRCCVPLPNITINRLFIFITADNALANVVLVPIAVAKGVSKHVPRNENH